MYLGFPFESKFYKPLFFAETIIVRTWVKELSKRSVQVSFLMLKKRTQEKAAEGSAVFVMINAETGRPEAIPEDIKEKYSI